MAGENLAASLGLPLEVKFQDLKKFEKMAKKNFASNKYVSISPRE